MHVDESIFLFYLHMYLYGRFVNYSCCIDPGGKKIKKYSPAGLESINPDTEEYNGKSFYQFCKTFHIFPVLTQESTCRRVTQHVRFDHFTISLILLFSY